MLGRNFNEISNSYTTLSTLLDAGSDLIATLEFLERSSSEPLLARRLVVQIKRGGKLHEVMEKADLPRLDCSMIRAGESSGTLVEVTRGLATYYRDRHDIERTLKFALVKPFFMFAIAVVTSAIPGWFAGTTTLFTFVLMTVAPIAIVAGAIAYGFFIFRSAIRKPELAKKLSSLVTRVKGLNIISESLATERFFVAFLLCVKAGCALEETTAVLETVSQGSSLQPLIGPLRVFAAKEGFAPALARAGVLSDEQISGIRVGEFTGRLDAQLEILVKEASGKVRFQLKLFEEWAPRVLYALIAIFIAANIIMNGLRSTIPEGLDLD